MLLIFEDLNEFIFQREDLKMKNLRLWIFACLIALALTAQKVNLPELSKVDVLDDSEIVKLAEEEKFRIELSGRTISHSIEFKPENTGECKFIEPSISYKAFAQSQAVFDNEDEIAALLPLKKREIVIVADPFYNVASYSIDGHFLLKSRLPKTSLLKGQSKQKTKLINPVLLATPNEDYVYFLTPERSFIFHYSSLSSDMKQLKLQGSPSIILQAVENQGYVIMCAGISGLLVYQINQQTKQLKLIQKIQPKDPTNAPLDIELNEQTQLLYVMNYEKTIQVYAFDPTAHAQNSTKPVLREYDEISLLTITINHSAEPNPIDMIGNMNLEISRDREEQTLLILFSHNSKTVVAELNYNSMAKKYSFVRYFKFSMMIKEIHAISDVMVVVGEGLLGMFPYGIDPHLIVEEFNGFMTLTPIEKIVLTEAPFFVGVTKNEIEYGGIFLNNEAGINCHLTSTSQLKYHCDQLQVKFKANLTVCGDLYPVRIDKYCQYEKTFIIKQMELTASAPVATSLWIATILLTLLIVVGLCCVFTIHKKKEKQIRKLQLYFEQKRRPSEIPATSERRK